MLYFWITNASRAHRASRNDGSGKSTPISCSGKGYFHRGRSKELSLSPASSSSETQLDKIFQKSMQPSALHGSNPQVATSNGTVDIPWIKSRSRGTSSESTSNNQSSSISYPYAKQKIYTRKASSTSLL